MAFSRERRRVHRCPVKSSFRFLCVWCVAECWWNSIELSPSTMKIRAFILFLWRIQCVSLSTWIILRFCFPSSFKGLALSIRLICVVARSVRCRRDIFISQIRHNNAFGIVSTWDFHWFIHAHIDSGHMIAKSILFSTYRSSIEMSRWKAEVQYAIAHNSIGFAGFMAHPLEWKTHKF